LSPAFFNENISAGYVERHLPSALKEMGAWLLTGLRKVF
jgi:hypothetical protein